MREHPAQQACAVLAVVALLTTSAIALGAWSVRVAARIIYER